MEKDIQEDYYKNGQLKYRHRTKMVQVLRPTPVQFFSNAGIFSVSSVNSVIEFRGKGIWEGYNPDGTLQYKGLVTDGVYEGLWYKEHTYMYYL